LRLRRLHPSENCLTFNFFLTMYTFTRILFLFFFGTLITADRSHHNRYHRYHGVPTKDGRYMPDKSRPEFETQPENLLGEWLHSLVKRDPTGQLQDIFINGSVPHQAGFDEILASLNIPEPVDKNQTILPPHVPLPWPPQEASVLFKHLNYPIDPKCTADHSNWQVPGIYRCLASLFLHWRTNDMQVVSNLRWILQLVEER